MKTATKKTTTKKRTMTAKERALHAEVQRSRVRIKEMQKQMDDVQMDVIHHKIRWMQEGADRSVKEDMGKRINHVVYTELERLAENLKEDARRRAQQFVITGGDRDDIPSSVTVSLRAADRIVEIAAQEAGHSLDLMVRR